MQNRFGPLKQFSGMGLSQNSSTHSAETQVDNEQRDLNTDSITKPMENSQSTKKDVYFPKSPSTIVESLKADPTILQPQTRTKRPALSLAAPDFFPIVTNIHISHQKDHVQANLLRLACYICLFPRVDSVRRQPIIPPRDSLIKHKATFHPVCFSPPCRAFHEQQ